MTIDSNKKNEKTKSDTKNLETLEDNTKVIKKPKNNKQNTEATEVPSEKLYDFNDNRGDESSSLSKKKLKSSEYVEPGDEAFGKKNLQSETNQANNSSNQKRQHSVFVPMFFGGLTAGILSFAAAYLVFNSYFLGKGSAINEMKLSLNSQIAKNSNKVLRIESKFEDQTLKISKLEKDFETLFQKIQQVSAKLDRNSSLIYDNQDLRLLAENLEKLISDADDRISSLENRPVGETFSSDVIEAYNKEVNDLIETMAVQREKAEQIFDDANAREEKLAEIEQKTDARDALYDIKNMVEAGQGFKDPLAKFQQITDATIPRVLSVASLKGVKNLEELINAFPEAARAAIAAERKDSAYDGTFESLLEFIKSKFQERSVVPREGTNADAILSRVEAALKNGNLDIAIHELAKLKPPAADIMAVWQALLLQRIEVIKAIDIIGAMTE